MTETKESYGGNGKNPSPQPDLQTVINNIYARLGTLEAQRSEILAQLAPIDGAIHELRVLLSQVTGANVAEPTQMPNTVGSASHLVAQQPMSTIPAQYPFRPTPPTNPAQPERQPVNLRRRGPQQEPLTASEERQTQPRNVPSPKTGTPVPNNVALLRTAIQRKGSKG